MTAPETLAANAAAEAEAEDRPGDSGSELESLVSKTFYAFCGLTHSFGTQNAKMQRLSRYNRRLFACNQELTITAFRAKAERLRSARWFY